MLYGKLHADGFWDIEVCPAPYRTGVIPFKELKYEISRSINHKII